MIISHKKQIFAVLFIGLLFVLIYFAPKKTSTQPVAEEVAHDESLHEAVELVTSGTDPMKGIMQLRGIAEKNPDNAEAQFYLGVFSIQSGQFDKAIERLEIVKKLTPDNYESIFYLGLSYKEVGDTQKAVENLESYMNSGDEKFKKDAENILLILKTE